MKYDFRRYYTTCPGCARLVWKGKFNPASNRCDRCLGLEPSPPKTTRAQRREAARNATLLVNDGAGI